VNGALGQVLGNMALVLTFLAGRITKSVFLGTLRDAEVEILLENARYAVTETCLALTIFREELNVRVAALFTALLFAKIFHWLCASRVEFVSILHLRVVVRALVTVVQQQVEQQDDASHFTYIRIFMLMSSLVAVDVAMVSVAAYVSFQAGQFLPSVWLLFGFEFLVSCHSKIDMLSLNPLANLHRLAKVLSITCVSIFVRFLLHMVEQRFQGAWESKVGRLHPSFTFRKPSPYHISL
jgi:E3 ubiquitin-protein ligase synoviolin